MHATHSRAASRLTGMQVRARVFPIAQSPQRRSPAQSAARWADACRQQGLVHHRPKHRHVQQGHLGLDDRVPTLKRARVGHGRRVHRPLVLLQQNAQAGVGLVPVVVVVVERGQASRIVGEVRGGSAGWEVCRLWPSAPPPPSHQSRYWAPADRTRSSTRLPSIQGEPS